MKKLFKATILAMMCAAIVLVLHPAQAKADTATKVLPANQDYVDSVNVEDGTNFYEFIMPEDGKVTFSMTMVPGQAETRWSSWGMWVYNSKQEELDYDSYFDNGYTSKSYNFKKGSKFIVKVKDKSVRYRNGVKYTLYANVEPTTNWELEDEKGTPTVLTNKKTMNGVLHVPEDIDLFQYKIPANGPTSFTFDVPDMSIKANNDGWKVTFLDSKKNEIYKEDTKGGLVSRPFNFKKGTTLYVKVEAKCNYIDTPTGVPYTLTANTIASKEWEIEKNDSFVGATKIASKKVKASLYNHEDMDYFVYKAAGSKTQIKFTSSVNADTVSNEWRVRVFDKNKKLVKDYTTKAGASKTIKTKKGQKYYIVVSSSTSYYSYNNPTLGQVYGLTCKKK